MYEPSPVLKGINQSIPLRGMVKNAANSLIVKSLEVANRALTSTLVVYEKKIFQNIFGAPPSKKQIEKELIDLPKEVICKIPQLSLKGGNLSHFFNFCEAFRINPKRCESLAKKVRL